MGLRSRHLPCAVVTCESAARAKGIPRERELKSLLLESDRGYLLAHVRGSRRLSLRAVKRSLGVRHASLLDLSTLHSLGFQPGAIHPFQPTLWQMPQVITRAVFDLPWVSTNAGTLRSYVVFDPLILLHARDVILGDFEDPQVSVA